MYAIAIPPIDGWRLLHDGLRVLSLPVDLPVDAWPKPFVVRAQAGGRIGIQQPARVAVYVTDEWPNDTRNLLGEPIAHLDNDVALVKTKSTVRNLSEHGLFPVHSLPLRSLVAVASITGTEKDRRTIAGCYEAPHCRAETEDGEADGWMMGHLDGESHYACPDCAGGLWDAVAMDRETASSQGFLWRVGSVERITPIPHGRPCAMAHAPHQHTEEKATVWPLSDAVSTQIGATL